MVLRFVHCGDWQEEPGNETQHAREACEIGALLRRWRSRVSVFGSRFLCGSHLRPLPPASAYQTAGDNCTLHLPGQQQQHLKR